ncbi:MAG: tetratricopeptide repeat protein [Candidatus Eisenbacteria bacterium]|uniref:Tetratricopeptide repeat protein n=1 Tax=Eiseniibacteriota bacterium TaxID=2212470 RepID=A0A948RST7_UNCEI|nr:tetratricopeptide repeat protein [Candidatus Eisenbacteria bacterium]
MIAAWSFPNGRPSLIRSKAMVNSLQAWTQILESSGESYPVEDPLAMPLLAVQSFWVGIDWIKGTPRPAILEMVREREELWSIVLAILTLAAALGAGWLITRRERSGWLAGILLALSTLWLADLYEPSGSIALAFGLLCCATSALPLWCRAMGLGMMLGTSPWGLPVAAGVLLTSLTASTGDARRQWGTLLVVSLPLACLWNPQILLGWNDWWSLTLWNLRVLGWMGPLTESFVRLDPLWKLLRTSFGPAALLLILIGSAARLKSPRNPGALLALIIVLLIPLGATWGRMTRAAVVPLIPYLAILAAEGGMIVWIRLQGWFQRSAHRPVLIGALALLLIPPAPRLVKEVSSWRLPSAEQAALDWLEDQVGQGARIVLDPMAPAPLMGWKQDKTADRPAHVLRIPHHDLRPDYYRGAHWMGWYQPFDYLVLSARTVGPLWDARDRFPDIFGFYTQALMEMTPIEEWGGPGWRDGKISIIPMPGDTLGAGWRTRLQAGSNQGLQPDFLTSLGGHLAEIGSNEEALAVLKRAQELGAATRSLYLNLGRLYLKQQDHAEAAKIIEGGLSRWPDDPPLLRLQGANFAQGGLWRRAIRTFAELIRVAPWDHQARLDLAAALLMDGQKERARIVLSDYLKRTSPDERPEEVERLIRTLFPGGLGG